jgi:hypothetical protein
MKQRWIAALMVTIAVLAGGIARANDSHNGDHGGTKPGNTTGQCVREAAAEKKTCTQVCKDDFLTAVDTCRGLNHDCAQTARDARDACVHDVLTALQQCVQDTCGAIRDQIDQCRVDFPKGSPERDSCIDAAQVAAFQCRDACRESVQLFSSLKTCRDEFRADLKACVAPAPTPK